VDCTKGLEWSTECEAVNGVPGDSVIDSFAGVGPTLKGDKEEPGESSASCFRLVDLFGGTGLFGFVPFSVFWVGDCTGDAWMLRADSGVAAKFRSEAASGDGGVVGVCSSDEDILQVKKIERLVLDNDGFEYCHLKVRILSPESVLRD